MTECIQTFTVITGFHSQHYIKQQKPHYTRQSFPVGFIGLMCMHLGFCDLKVRSPDVHLVHSSVTLTVSHSGKEPTVNLYIVFFHKLQQHLLCMRFTIDYHSIIYMLYVSSVYGRKSCVHCVSSGTNAGHNK